MSIWAWIFRVAAGRFLMGVLLVFLGCRGLDMPTLEIEGEVVIQSVLGGFGLWPYVLCLVVGVVLITWSYITAKEWSVAKFHNPEIQAIADQMDAAIRAEKESPAGQRKSRIKFIGVAAILFGVGVVVTGLFSDEILHSDWYKIWFGFGMGLTGLGSAAAALFWD
jgi:hypothetical protein